MVRPIRFSKNTLVFTKHFGMLRIVYADKCVPNDIKYVGRTFANDVSYNISADEVLQVINASEFESGLLDR